MKYFADFAGQEARGMRADARLDPGAMVKQVAAEMGCADPYHFSRVFKHVHGRHPPPAAFVRLRDS